MSLALKDDLTNIRFSFTVSLSGKKEGTKTKRRRRQKEDGDEEEVSDEEMNEEEEAVNVEVIDYAHSKI